ncbi:MAG: MBL fold metallo-hydrolase [bacterium]|jgi:hydroxyacylglutathione hydrolase
MRLLPDIYMVAGSALKAEPSDANAYLVDGGEKVVLIDTGGGYNPKALADEMKQHGFSPERVDMIINTHCHFDHTGGNRWLRENYGCKTAIHHTEKEAIEKNTELTVAKLYEHNLEPCPVDIPMQGNEVIDLGKYKLETIHTPGHTPGSLCFLLRQGDKKILFVGDALSLLGLPGESIETITASLHKLLGLEADVIFSGHDEGVIIDTAGHLKAHLAALEAGKE